MQIIRARGIDIAYEHVGEGPLLVLVHGAAEDGRIWRPQLAVLADEFTVVAWDEPGAGRSSDLPVISPRRTTRTVSRPSSRLSSSDPPTSPGSPGAAPSSRSSTDTIRSSSRA